MSRKSVRYELEQNGVAVVKIDEPPMNPFNDKVKQELMAVLRKLDEIKDQLKALILTGAGEGAFVAGADIKVFMTLNSRSFKERLKRAKKIFIQVEEFERPIICAINGFCLGAGLELAMCCDIRIAADHAKLGQPEVNLGIIPGAGGTQRLTRLVGEGIAKELIYTGRFIDAKEAKDIGLVNKVVTKDRLMIEAMEMAELIASKPVLAIKAAKDVVHAGASMPLDESLDLEIDRCSSLAGTVDQKEGVAAFLEKRKPVFVGR